MNAKSARSRDDAYILAGVVELSIMGWTFAGMVIELKGRTPAVSLMATVVACPIFSPISTARARFCAHIIPLPSARPLCSSLISAALISSSVTVGSGSRLSSGVIHSSKGIAGIGKIGYLPSDVGGVGILSRIRSIDLRDGSTEPPLVTRKRRWTRNH